MLYNVWNKTIDFDINSIKEVAKTVKVKNFKINKEKLSDKKVEFD